MTEAADITFTAAQIFSGISILGGIMLAIVTSYFWYVINGIKRGQKRIHDKIDETDKGLNKYIQNTIKLDKEHEVTKNRIEGLYEKMDIITSSMMNMTSEINSLTKTVSRIDGKLDAFFEHNKK